MNWTTTNDEWVFALEDWSLYSGKEISSSSWRVMLWALCQSRGNAHQLEIFDAFYKADGREKLVCACLSKSHINHIYIIICAAVYARLENASRIISHFWRVYYSIKNIFLIELFIIMIWKGLLEWKKNKAEQKIGARNALERIVDDFNYWWILTGSLSVCILYSFCLK